MKGIIKPREETLHILPIQESKNTIELPVEEYTRLKDIETRFQIIREQMLRAEYCPIHTQIILGIEKEYKQKESPKQGDLKQSATDGQLM